jgi:hypothetical protein
VYPDQEAQWLSENRGMKRQFRLPYLKQSYRLSGGKPLFTDRDGRPCAVVNEYGDGRAYIIGGLPSLYLGVGSGKYGGGSAVQTGGSADGGSRDAAGPWPALLSAIAGQAGVVRPVEFSGGHGDVTARYLENTDERIVFFINYSRTRPARICFSESVIRLEPGTESRQKSTAEVSGKTCRTGERETECRHIELAPLSWTVVSMPKKG